MKTNFSRDANGGMTLIEVLVVIACVVILIAFLLPRLNTPEHATRPMCMNNLKTIGIELIMYTEDNHGKFPICVSITNGGTMEYLDRNQTFPHYQKLSADTNLVRFLVCPADKKRKAAASFATLTDSNISYCLNADVSTNNPTQSIMTSDRNLQVNGQPVHHGTLVLSTDMDAGWTPEMHPGGGVLGFADGHVEFCRITNLNFIIQRQGLATNRFSVP
jgi:prepilin-type N-terminal cleavage/methylation domain-containing protein/prepilin-type processing-associated H-X9-DG protein